MPNIHAFQLGQFRCHVINDGDTEYATSDFLFYNAPEGDLKTQMSRYGLNPEHIRCANNCLVVNTGAHLVLIDTGCGIESTRRPGLEHTGNLLAGLKAAGIRPDDIDIVILTHLHGDHTFGILDAKGRLAFTNARFFMMKPDWDEGIQIEELYAVWKHMEDRMEPLTSEREIVPGVTAIPATGHTAGHMIVSVVSGKEELLITGDVFAHPIHASHPDWTMSHETDKAAAVKNRKNILRRAAEEHILVHAYHIAFPGLGRIVQEEQGWEWKPVE